jgi:hypothetical protein
MPSAVMLSVVMLSVVMLSVVAPLVQPEKELDAEKKCNLNYHSVGDEKSYTKAQCYKTFYIQYLPTFVKS